MRGEKEENLAAFAKNKHVVDGQIILLVNNPSSSVADLRPLSLSVLRMLYQTFATIGKIDYSLCLEKPALIIGKQNTIFHFDGARREENNNKSRHIMMCYSRSRFLPFFAFDSRCMLEDYSFALFFFVFVLVLFPRGKLGFLL